MSEYMKWESTQFADKGKVKKEPVSLWQVRYYLWYPIVTVIKSVSLISHSSVSDVLMFLGQSRVCHDNRNIAVLLTSQPQGIANNRYVHVTSRHIRSFFFWDGNNGSCTGRKTKSNFASLGTFQLSTKWKGRASQFRQGNLRKWVVHEYTSPELKNERAVLLSERVSFSDGGLY